MPELLREKTVTARKVHRCMTCNAPAIQAGQTYCRQTYVYDGRVYDWVQCVECAELASPVFDWASYIDEGIGQEDYAEWASEHEDDPAWGEKARAYLARIRPAVNERGEDQ